MCIRISLLLLLSLLFSCQEAKLEKSFQIEAPTFDTFPINASVRAIEVVDELNMWFAAGDGMDFNPKKEKGKLTSIFPWRMNT